MRRVSMVPVLVVLTGAGAACGRPNPGFDVAAPRQETTSTNGEASTAESTGTPPTTSGDTTGAVTVTTTGATTMVVDPSTTTGGSSSTGAERVTWPTDCAEADRIETRAGVAVADTFLLHEQYVGQSDCSFGGAVLCADLEMGKTDYFDVVFDNSSNAMANDDYASLFAARFPTPDAEFEGLKVDPDGYLAIRVTIRVVKSAQNPNPWVPIAFDVYRFAEGDTWTEGEGFGFTPCVAPAASFRCRTCPEMNAPGTCVADWDTIGYPFKEGVNVALAGTTLQSDPGEGVDLAFEFPPDDWDWLTKEGMLLVPQSAVPKHVVEVKTKDYDNGSLGPFISVVHCPPEIG